MRIVTSLAFLCALTCLPLEITAQKRANSNKPSTAAGSSRPVCEGQPIPKEFVVVGLKRSGRCGSLPELVVKRPAASETVCANSPIPSGYSMTEVTSLHACSGASPNPLTNALFIARDGAVTVQPGRASQRARSYDNEGEESAPLTRRAARPQDDTARIVEERATRINQQAEDSLAQKAAKDKFELARKEMIFTGMIKNEVLRSWWKPYKVDALTTDEGTWEIWRYRRPGGTASLHFNQNGILKYIEH
jgi:hypothetical protein